MMSFMCIVYTRTRRRRRRRPRLGPFLCVRSLRAALDPCSLAAPSETTILYNSRLRYVLCTRGLFEISQLRVIRFSFLVDFPNRPRLYIHTDSIIIIAVEYNNSVYHKKHIRTNLTRISKYFRYLRATGMDKYPHDDVSWMALTFNDF